MPAIESTDSDVIQVLAPARDVAVAHVRRVALNADGQPLTTTPETRCAFSEMALR